jgi:uncharacterized protein (DUF1810 family)
MESDDLSKFLTAQERDYSGALAEIKKGKKHGHWMWYIFPQITGLGFSETSRYYAIADIEHAARYLQHPVLGKRLIEISEAMLAVKGKTANQILGSPDDLKLKSCMTLFTLVEDKNSVFQAVLDQFFNGNLDQKTVDIAR